VSKLGAITLTRQGVDICRRIQSAMPACEVFVAQKYDAIAPAQWRRFDGKLAPLVKEIFGAYDGLIFVMATGIVVRTIAPHIVDKRYDPGIVVVDIAGRFAISLCAGHLGGANQLACQLGEILGAVPVVTTGTDVNQTLAPDMLAKDLGAEIENWEALKTVSGMLVDGEPVAVFAEDNVRLPDLEPLAARGVVRIASFAQLDSRFRAAVMITHRILASRTPADIPTLWVRPKSLVVGVGCDRGTTVEEIEQAFEQVLLDHGLSPLSVRNLATYTLKKDEPGLCTFAQKRGLALTAFEREEINRVEHLIPNPSPTVLKYTGVLGVAEPAAMLSAGTQSLLVPKRKCGRVTLAIALIEEGHVR
jgi:cobalt-precorrin 5A hydrolase